MLSEFILVAIVFQTIAISLLIYLVLDSRKDFSDEKKKQQTAVKQFEDTITDGVKEWIANEKPDLLESFDVSDIGNFEGLNSGVMSLLGSRSFFTQLFSQMLTDDNQSLMEISKYTKIPPPILKPLLTNVMAGIAQVINSAATKKIIHRNTDAIAEGSIKGNGRIPQYKHIKSNNSF